MDTDTTSPDALRDNMVDRVRGMGHAWRGRVEQVLRQVPRHWFVPDAEPTAAYHPWQAVITHRFEDGTSLSCASAPFVVAMMLDQLDVQPGQRVLEIGAGTGYNAALLAELTGTETNVTTVDLDPDVTNTAARSLHQTGYSGVHVLTGDGTVGAPEYAPYDRIIATVSPWDIPPAWWQQLAPGGRLVAPLRWRGQTRSIGCTYRNNRLVSDSVELCGFVPLVTDDDGERCSPLTDDERVSVYWDQDQHLGPGELHDILRQPRTASWSTVTIAADEPYDVLWLQLTMTEPRTCRLNAHPDIPAEVCDPIAPIRTPVLAQGTSLAYLTSRRADADGEARWELGAIAHGPDAAELARQLCDQILAWSPHRERRPTITLHPAETLDSELAAPAIDKTHSRLVLTEEDIPDCCQ